MAIGNHNDAGEPPARFGYQPSGPKVDVPRIGAATFGRVRRTNVGGAKLGMPSASTLDYAHKLTTTTILLLAIAAFLLFGPTTFRGKLGALARKHVGGR